MKCSILLKASVLTLAMAGFIGCGDGGSNSTDTEDDLGSSDVIDGGTTNSVTEEVVIRDVFGRDGNLWKPSGDEHGSSPGAVVMIFSPKYGKEFDKCEFKTKGGGVRRATCINNVPWTHKPYSCFANPSHGGDRQHWRTFTSCYDLAEVYASCTLGNKKYIFTAPGGQGAAVCTRFG